MSLRVVSTLEEFRTLITTTDFVFVKFFATWCGPCRSYAPQFEAIARQYASPRCAFVEVDSSQASPIAQVYSVASLPTTLFFAGGQLVSSIVGANVPEVSALAGYVAAGWNPLSIALAVGKSLPACAELVKTSDLSWVHPGVPDASLRGATPMDAALMSRSRDRVRLLLDAGFDPRRPGLNGLTPLQCAEGMQRAKCAEEIRNHLAGVPAPAAAPAPAPAPRSACGGGCGGCPGGACPLPQRTRAPAPAPAAAPAPASSCKCGTAVRVTELEARVATLEATIQQMQATIERLSGGM